MSQKYAAYSPDTGELLGFYDSVDSPPPERLSVIEITDSEWQVGCTTGGCSVINGVFCHPPIQGADEIAKNNADGLTMVVNKYLDSTAQATGYMSIQDALSYLQSTNAARKAKASAIFHWRETVWDAAEPVIADIKAMTIGMPDVSLFVAGLPSYTPA